MPDCSPEMMAQRAKWIADLYARIFTAAGITSVADRGRSVTYNTDTSKLLPLLDRLQADQDACMGKRSGMRMAYLPLCR